MRRGLYDYSGRLAQTQALKRLVRTKHGSEPCPGSVVCGLSALTLIASLPRVAKPSADPETLRRHQ